jgi:hypothetical protein
VTDWLLAINNDGGALDLRSAKFTHPKRKAIEHNPDSKKSYENCGRYNTPHAWIFSEKFSNSVE